MHKVAHELNSWIEKGQMQLCLPARPINRAKSVKPMFQSAQGPRVLDIMDRKVVSIGEGEKIKAAAQKLLKGETNHLPGLSGHGVLVGIVTTFDVSKSVANPGKTHLVRGIMKKKVITTTPDESRGIAVQKLEKYNIGAMPVIDSHHHVLNILTAMDPGKLFGGRWLK